MHHTVEPLNDILKQPTWLVGELRSDHAGEMGAVFIYQGILAVARNEALREFAECHLKTERKHLSAMEGLLPEHSRSRLISLWKIAGFVIGAVPGIFGPKATYATIAAVETFVDTHYQQQIDRLREDSLLPELVDMLESFRLDEVEHKHEAEQAFDSQPNWLLRSWCNLVGFGSELAVSVAKRF